MKAKYTYLFLDIDGVLNCSQSYQKSRKNGLRYCDLYEHIGIRNLLCLKYFCYNTPNLRIILSSSWRGLPLLEKKLKVLFKKYGIPYIFGRTPKLKTSYCRGDEIQLYMNKYDIKKNQIIIFDDDSDMGELIDRHIKTNFHFEGLCYRHLVQAWKLLENRKEENKI